MIIMRNDNLRKVLTLFSASLLAGCGGGTSVVNGPNLDAPSEIVSENLSQTVLSLRAINQGWANSNRINSEVLKEYNNGQAIVAVKGDLEDGGVGSITPRYYFVLSTDASTVIDTFNGVVVWESIETLSNTGNRYSVERVGVNSKGSNVNAVTSGINLNLSGSEYTSLSAVTIGEVQGILTSGTVTSTLPSGKLAYNGGVTIGLNNKLEGSENFLLIADFDNTTVSFTASTENLFTSANEIQIDPATGSFSGVGVDIGERNSTFSVPANVVGAFAGISADGVHGVAYPVNDDENDAFVAFIGQR